MDKCNSDFLFGMLIATVVIGVIIFAKFITVNIISEDIEKKKTEHLTITYKNSKLNIVDKEMLVNMMKQHFPSSNWSHIDTKANESHVELDAWCTEKEH